MADPNTDQSGFQAALEQCAIRSSAMYHLLSETPVGQRFVADTPGLDIDPSFLQGPLAEWENRVKQVRNQVLKGSLPGQGNLLVNWNAGAQEYLNQLARHQAHYRDAMAKASAMPPGPERNLYIHDFILAPLFGGARFQVIGDSRTPWISTVNDWCLPIQLEHLLNIGYDEDSYLNSIKNMVQSFDPASIPDWWYEQFEAFGAWVQKKIDEKEAEIARPYKKQIKTGFAVVGGIAALALFIALRK